MKQAFGASRAAAACALARGQRHLRKEAMNDRSGAELGVFSKTVRPEDMARMIGMECDESHAVGSPGGEATLIHRENAWILRSRLPDTAPLEDHVADVLERIAPAAKGLKKLAGRSDVELELGCFIESSDADQGVSFPRWQVTALAELGASIDVEVSVTGEDDGDTDKPGS